MGATVSTAAAGGRERSDPHQDQDLDQDSWWGTSGSQDGDGEALQDDAEVLRAVLRHVEDLRGELGAERQERQQLWGALARPTGQQEAGAGAGGPQSAAGRRRDHEQELSLLREQLGLQREARRRKLEQVSAEMERLRGELGAERARRQEQQQALPQPQPAWEALMLESDQLRDDLLQERKARVDLAHQRDGLEEHNKRLLAALGEAEGLARIERDAADLLRGEGVRLEALVKDVGEELIRCKEEAAAAVQERTELVQQVGALKEVVAISKRMLAIREDQVRDMKEKLAAIEDRIGSQHSSTTIANLRTEYEKQIKNIRDLKQLYEERARVLQEENYKQAVELERKTKEVDEMQDTVKELEEKTSQLETSLTERGEALEELEFQLGDSVAECQSLTAQMKRINSLFTQMLLGSAASSDIDLDRLSRLLHENHDLITDITVKGGGSDIAPVLPKLILDLLTQVEDERTNQEDQTAEGEDVEERTEEEKPAEMAEMSESKEDAATPSDKEELVNEITSNLPKVWAVLRELVSQQAGRGMRRGSVGDSEKGRSSCYTSVNTPGGPRKVISVSKTYIRLKDLILEKRALQRELGRLKQLNGHLEVRLDEQESRLSQVSTELHKTWGLVGRLQAQHQQLHTHEKILRYELHQKRELLSELKQELEYCREKWESARQKNTQTDREWRQLRREFASRKARDAAHLDFLNNSGESGLGEDSGEDDIDSSGRSESPSVAEDVETSLPSPTPAGEEDLPVDTAAPSIQVSLVPLLEDTIEHEGELQSLELTPVQAVTSSAFVVTTEPLVTTVVRSEAVVLETEVVPSSPVQRRALREPEDNTESCDLTDLKARALVAYAKRVASLQVETQTEVSQENSRAVPPSEGCPSEESEPVEDEDVPHVEERTSLGKGKEESLTSADSIDTVTTGARGAGEELEDIGFESAPRPCVVPLFGATPQPTDTTPSPLLFSTIDIKSMDFSDVSSFLNPTPQEPPPPPPLPPPPSQPSSRSPEDILAARAARLQRLEEQADWLRRKWAHTSQRGSALSSKLDEIHGQYGTASPASSPSPASSSAGSPSPSPSPSPRTEQILAARAERLSRLEQQCNSLFDQVSRTSRISSALSSRLDQYGASAAPAPCDNPPAPPPPPPPLPDTLPAFRLPLTRLESQQDTEDNDN